MSTALEIARAFETAWQSGDFDRARAYVADDLVYDSPFGRETSAEAVIGQYAGIMQVVTGPAHEMAAFGDDRSALIMSVLPTSVFGPSVSATHYVVRDGKITSATLVYDATAAKSQQRA
jgi:ketosteroid isomerase-like protein